MPQFLFTLDRRFVNLAYVVHTVPNKRTDTTTLYDRDGVALGTRYGLIDLQELRGPSTRKAAPKSRRLTRPSRRAGGKTARPAPRLD
jgi:hypothetical protein